MRALLAAAFLLTTAAAPGAAPEGWPGLQREILATVAGSTDCGSMSRDLGICRSDDQQVPSPAHASLSDACRGQPASYLAGFGDRAADRRSRRAAATGLEQLMQTGPFAAAIGTTDKEILAALHDRDQALRFYRPEAQVENPVMLEQTKWVVICGHARFAHGYVRDFLSRTEPAALAADKDLANHAWLLVQHSDFDPVYQLAMSRYFAGSAEPHMRRHSAYLYDRAMVNMHQRQRFATQLRCEEGRREPFPLTDPVAVDQRRAALGLEPMSEYLARFPRPCPPPKPK